MRPALLFVALTISIPSSAQFTLQTSNTTADLRGIHNVGNGVAWASGTNGTVLRTEDGGYVWQSCSIPPGAEKLDFRGIQAFDANTAIVMSSGPGLQSRLYKTTDGCHTWKLVFTNPDKDGFWDAISLVREPAMGNSHARWSGVVVGDPVKGRFAEFVSTDNGDHWEPLAGNPGAPHAKGGEALFAASNQSLLLDSNLSVMLVTGGLPGARSIVLSEYIKHDPRVSWSFVGGSIPLVKGESAGAFAVAREHSAANGGNFDPSDKWRLLWIDRGLCVAVGGDYRKPDSSEGTSAVTSDSGLHWQPAQTPPHGYRSSVAYDPSTKTWITVGPNGTDISTDDGRNWRPVHPNPALHEAPDADRNWNALSLPYVVGPHGRIGRLDPAALQNEQPHP